jgi:hypothetical protein
MSRNAVLRGELIELTAIFQDAAEQDTDPTNLKVSVYPPGNNPELGASPSDAWVYEATLTDGGTGPQASSSRLVERTSLGHYKYTLLVPDDAALGAAFDRWEGTVDLMDLDETFTFTVVGGGSVGVSQLYENNIVFVQLDESIAADDGSTLGEDYVWYFTTTYNPMYSHIRRVRLDLGPLIADVPDDTVNLAIFEASLHTNAISFVESDIPNLDYLTAAKREYTTCLAELTLVRGLQGSGLGHDRLGKTLADLTVSRGGLGSMMDKKAAELQECVARWAVPVSSGGNSTPDTSLQPGSAIKGSTADDAIGVGREWHPTSYAGSDTPLGNTFSRSRTPDGTASLRRWVRDYRKR